MDFCGPSGRAMVATTWSPVSRCWARSLRRRPRWTEVGITAVSPPQGEWLHKYQCTNKTIDIHIGISKDEVIVDQNAAGHSVQLEVRGHDGQTEVTKSDFSAGVEVSAAAIKARFGASLGSCVGDGAANLAFTLRLPLLRLRLKNPPSHKSPYVFEVLLGARVEGTLEKAGGRDAILSGALKVRGDPGSATVGAEVSARHRSERRQQDYYWKLEQIGGVPIGLAKNDKSLSKMYALLETWTKETRKMPATWQVLLVHVKAPRDGGNDSGSSLTGLTPADVLRRCDLEKYAPWFEENRLATVEEIRKLKYQDFREEMQPSEASRLLKVLHGCVEGRPRRVDLAQSLLREVLGIAQLEQLEDAQIGLQQLVKMKEPQLKKLFPKLIDRRNVKNKLQRHVDEATATATPEAAPHQPLLENSLRADAGREGVPEVPKPNPKVSEEALATARSASTATGGTMRSVSSVVSTADTQSSGAAGHLNTSGERRPNLGWHFWHEGTHKVIIGSGSNGQVFKMQCDGVQYAVKLLKNATSTRHAQKAMNDARVLRALKHDNIVAYKGCAMNDEKDSCEVLLFMEHIGGGTLQELVDSRLRKRSKSKRSDDSVLFTEHEMAIVMGQLIDALAYCERSMLVHGDIKPQNILMKSRVEPLTIKLCDFSEVNLGTGTPRFMSAERLREFEIASRLADQSADAGTPDVLGADVCNKSRKLPDRCVDKLKSDVFSTGLTMMSLHDPKVVKQGLNRDEHTLREALRSFPEGTAEQIEQIARLPQSMRAALQWRQEDRPTFEQLDAFIRTGIPLPLGNRRGEVEKEVEGEAEADMDEQEEFAQQPRLFQKEKVVEFAIAGRGAEQSVSLETFDFAGQDDYHHLFQLYLASCGISLVVFSLKTLAETPHEVDRQLRFWLSSLRVHAPRSRIMIVASHALAHSSAHSASHRDQAEIVARGVVKDIAGVSSQIRENREDGSFIFFVENSQPRSGIDILRKAIEAECRSVIDASAEVPLRWLRVQDTI
mmetsp:Transcript_59014/g.192494  ORF Transcript_59014/g.192494 Transcript_59014/m.192494 type:complete len:1006 (-) Transcript_59014:342-3359(-)